ncbi:MAG: glycosyltransferase [Timaviella obliquedivisa GSE-PSE-MK23-08B]|jgi:glycosyltransferase involved in cell wall biosynthesis|nr:glycosyltransferase [Timaviella obliquedivisa GSE-PSE-MK23-08B]
MSDRHPFVSVVIPVLNDAKRLQVCLQALAQQTYPQTCFEIIVVDNGSEPSEAIAPIVAAFAGITVATEEFPSSFAARNRGITLAKGEVIAFTDADCIPAVDWLEQGVGTLLQTANCGLVAGCVEVFFKNPDRATPVELYERITAFPQQKLIEKYHYGATANVFTFKQVIDRVGDFNADLKSSGDIEWGQRVAAFGYTQVYAKSACIAHPARDSFTQLFKRTVRLTGGIYDLYCRNRSLFAQNWIYFKTLIENLVPPINFVLMVSRHVELRSVWQKIQVALVMFFVRYVSAGELIRLKLGGVSTRD